MADTANVPDPSKANVVFVEPGKPIEQMSRAELDAMSDELFDAINAKRSGGQSTQE